MREFERIPNAREDRGVKGRVNHSRKANIFVLKNCLTLIQRILSSAPDFMLGEMKLHQYIFKDVAALVSLVRVLGERFCEERRSHVHVARDYDAVLINRHARHDLTAGHLWLQSA